MTDSIEDLARALLADLAAVHARILDEITDLATRWYGYQPPLRLHRLRQIEQEIRTIADEADTIAARQVMQTIHTAYGVGAWSTALTLQVGAEFTGVDVDAVTNLAQDTMQDLLHATRGMREDVKGIIRDLARDEVRAKLYTGQTAVQAGRDLATALRERGITAVVYSDGRRVSLPVYAEMVVRTKTAEAYQEGGLNQGERLGVDWWEILDGPDCGWTSHDDPQKATGMIVSLTDARAYPIAHPNCVMPDTVSGFYGGLTQITRAWFEGPSYTLAWRTQAGLHAATVGPNHPVLTSRGWVRAHLLTEGDQLVHDTRAPHAVAGAAAEADFEQVPPSIAQSFEAARAVGVHARVAPSSGDLHGDAIFCQGEVDVVDVDRVLLGEADPAFLEHPLQGDLVWSDVVQADSMQPGAEEHLVTTPAGTTNGIVSGGDTVRALLRAGLLCRQQCSGRDAAHEPTAAQPCAHGRGVHVQSATDLEAGHAAADVHVHDGVDGGCCGGHRFLLVPIESITVGRHCGWVYDTSTVGGAFTANGVVVKNCRRVATPRPDLASADGSPTAPTPLDRVAAIRAAADAAQQAAQRAVATSATPRRASAGLDLGAGVAVSAAARRFAARTA